MSTRRTFLATLSALGLGSLLPRTPPESAAVPIPKAVIHPVTRPFPSVLRDLDFLLYDHDGWYVVNDKRQWKTVEWAMISGEPFPLSDGWVIFTDLNIDNPMHSPSIMRVKFVHTPCP